MCETGTMWHVGVLQGNRALSGAKWVVFGVSALKMRSGAGVKSHVSSTYRSAS